MELLVKNMRPPARFEDVQSFGALGSGYRDQIDRVAEPCFERQRFEWDSRRYVS